MAPDILILQDILKKAEAKINGTNDRVADLARTFGSSQPTWSRELKALEDKGLVKKQAGGQRRELTASGRSFIQQHPQG